jgi:hypothetical protein
MSAASLTEDFRPTDLIISVGVAAVILVGSAVLITIASLNAPAAMSEIDKGASTPMRVTPVLDMEPLLKLGGKRDKMKLPDKWMRQKPAPVVEERAVVTTKAGKNAEDVPDKEMKIIDAGTEPAPLDAGLAKKVDEPVEATDAGPAVANTDEKGDPNGVKGGTETDPLKAHVVGQWRARIAGWFSSKFHVHGSGLPPEELTKYRVSAVVQLSPDGTVTDYSMTPSGNAAIDAAAKAALDAAKGQQIPPRPENLSPEPLPQFPVTFICTEKKCD